MTPNPPAFANVGSQFDFVKDELNAVGVDKIFPYENMEAFVQYMGNKVGERLKIGYKNASPRNAGDSRFMTLVERVNVRIVNSLNLGSPVNAARVQWDISDNLTNRLRSFIPHDFELHERACASFPAIKNVQE